MMIKNKVPQILEERGMSASELWRNCQKKDLELSWPSVYKVATKNPLPPTTSIGIVASVALGLDLGLGDITELVE